MTRGPGAMGRGAGIVLRGLGALMLVGFLVTAFTPLAERLEASTVAPPDIRPADAIVVLGQSVQADGTLPALSLQRTVHGIRLYKAGLAPLIVFSGARVPELGLSEAHVRAQVARELGVPAEAILTEDDVQTTRDEARRIAAQLLPRGARRILLVSDGDHLVRARGIFARAGFEVLTAPSNGAPGGTLGPETRVWSMRRVLLEVAARLYAAAL